MTIESNIAEQMRNSEFWQLPDTALVEILDPIEYMDRYIETLALGDTVRFTKMQAMYGVPGLGVRQWDDEDRQTVYEQLLARRDRLGLEFAVRQPKLSTGPISREAAEDRVRLELETRQKVDQYNQSNILSRFGQTVLMLCGRPNSRPTLEEFIQAGSLPGYIYFSEVPEKKTGISRVVVNREVDEAFVPRHVNAA